MEEAGKQVSCVGFRPRASLSMLWVRESFRAIKLLTVRIGSASDHLKTSHRITGVWPNKTTASVSRPHLNLNTWEREKETNKKCMKGMIKSNG